MAAWSLRIATSMFFAALPRRSPEIIRLAPLTLDGRVFVFAVVVALAATVLFALLPAIQASRVPLMSALHDRVAGSWRDSRFRGLLIVGQVARLDGAGRRGADVHQGRARAWRSVDLGYDIDQVVSMTPLAEARGLMPEVAAQLDADPRVEIVSVTGGNPLKGRGLQRRLAVAPAGSAVTNHYPLHVRRARATSSCCDCRVERGRVFSADESRGAPVAMVSAALPPRCGPASDAIGQTLVIEPSNGRPVVDLDMPGRDRRRCGA